MTIVACQDCAWCSPTDHLCHHALAETDTYDFLHGTVRRSFMTADQARGGFCTINAIRFHGLDAAGVRIRGSL